MTRLIIHVGPGKCGSSTIQQFFLTQKRPCIEGTCFKLLSPSLISELNKDESPELLIAALKEQLEDDLKDCDCLILSHEFLFQNPKAIKKICYLAKAMVEEITVIGYSRRQSDFLISAYAQWMFRSPERIGEVMNVFTKLGLDSMLFTGVERQLIASIENDFYSARQLSEYSILDWSSSYKSISQLVQEFGVLIKCGTLPNKESGISLVQDFCAKANLTLRVEMEGAAMKVANPSFNQDIVEAINNAVVFGLEVPRPHESNELIDLLSAKVKPVVNVSSDFFSNLKRYIEGYYWESNQEFCSEYSLSQTCFRPHGVTITKPEIMDVIAQEGYRRSINKSAIIENYRRLSAQLVELCFRLATDA